MLFCFCLLFYKQTLIINKNWTGGIDEDELMNGVKDTDVVVVDVHERNNSNKQLINN